MQMPNRSRGAGLRKRNSEEDCMETRERNSAKERECVWGGGDGVMNTITSAYSKDNLIVDMSIEELKKQARKKTKGLGLRPTKPSKKSLDKRPKGKGWQFVITEDGRLAWIRLRKLTPRECLRLMDVDEDKIDIMLTAGISDSQLYKMAGNSICVCCMEGIFYNAFSNEEIETLTLF
jgi:site-specific DNA-cytosine methylase